MKLTNKQKLSIWKSVKLNEDFFDDLSDNELIDNTVDDSFDEPIDNTDYTYHIQFLIFMYPFVKLDFSDDFEYVFDDPKYEHKLTIEHGFLSIKKVLEYILQATPIVTDYSKPKFCTLHDKIISIFPFMNNEPAPQLHVDKGEGDLGSRVYKEVFNKSISLEMTLNLSDKKNRANVKKLLYSFYKLKLIYNNLIKKINTKLRAVDLSLVEFGYSRNNPFVKMGPIVLLSPTNETRNYPPYVADTLLKDYD